MAMLGGNERAPWREWRPVEALSAGEIEAEWQALSASRDVLEGDITAIEARLRAAADAGDSDRDMRPKADALRHKSLILRACNRRLQALERRTGELRRRRHDPALARRREQYFIRAAREGLPAKYYQDFWKRADQMAAADGEETGATRCGS